MCIGVLLGLLIGVNTRSVPWKCIRVCVMTCDSPSQTITQHTN